MVLVAMAAVFLLAAPQSVAQVRERAIHEENPGYRIDVRYPEIPNAHTFNAAVQRVVDPLIREFRSELASPSLPGSPAYLEAHYTVAESGARIVSVLLEWDEYIPGAAHPEGGMAGVNYDLRTGRVLKLSDLFRPGVDYLPRLSALAIASLDRQELPDPDYVRRGAGPVGSNFKVFTLTGTALVLHFPAYQVGPGAAGPQTVVIPLEQLAPLMAPGLDLRRPEK